METCPPSSKPSLADRILLHISNWESVEGLPVGTATDDNRDALLGRVRAALVLIRTRDPRRFARLRQDVARFWIHLQAAGNSACYNLPLRTCELDPRYIMREDVTPSDIAALIVHEATHGRLRRFGYPEPLRKRIEALCRGQEAAFAQRLPEPDADKIRQKLARIAQVDGQFWSNAAFETRYQAGIEDALRYAGAPQWLAALAMRIGRITRTLFRWRAA